MKATKTNPQEYNIKPTETTSRYIKMSSTKCYIIQPAGITKI